MGLFTVAAVVVLAACGVASAFDTNLNYQAASRYNQYDDNDRSSKARKSYLYDLLAGDVSNGRRVQRTNAYNNLEYNPLSYYGSNLENSLLRSNDNKDSSLDKLTEAYKEAVREHIRDITRNGKRNEYADDKLKISEDSDHTAVANAVEAAVLARQSNEELNKAVQAANIAHSAPEAKKLLRSSAVASAFNSARLAQQSNAKLAAAVRSYSLVSRSGSSANATDKTTLDVAIDETRSAKKENVELTNKLDASPIAREKDASTSVMANVLKAAYHAHESNAEIGAAVMALNSARSDSNGVARSNAAVAAAVNAARLSQQSKDELVAAVAASRRNNDHDRNEDH